MWSLGAVVTFPARVRGVTSVPRTDLPGLVDVGDVVHQQVILPDLDAVAGGDEAFDVCASTGGWTTSTLIPFFTLALAPPSTSEPLRVWPLAR